MSNWRVLSISGSFDSVERSTMSKSSNLNELYLCVKTTDHMNTK